jgi:hypothetical protein
MKDSILVETNSP